MQLTKERMTLANLTTGTCDDGNILTNDLQQLLMYKKNNEQQYAEHRGSV